MIYLGIDPGVSGGLAAIFGDGSVLLGPWRGESEFAALLAEIVRGAAEEREPGLRVAIEQVGGFIGKPTPGSMMFRFGESFGWLRGYLAGQEIGYETVRPQAWQKGLGVGALKGAERKRRLRDIAKQRYPNVKITLATCDALLIADWLKRQT